ncbi:MAG TPA: PQQ-binding-like beta-propeller repeat protein [Opitutus sp.]|nr:PQQ-binding-like beta-propeller repeat protein [Opitutus sp.]
MRLAHQFARISRRLVLTASSLFSLAAAVGNTLPSHASVAAPATSPTVCRLLPAAQSARDTTSGPFRRAAHGYSTATAVSGRKTYVVYRVKYSDATAEPPSVASIQAHTALATTAVAEMSYGTVQLDWTIFEQAIPLPGTAASYRTVENNIDVSKMATDTFAWLAAHPDIAASYGKDHFDFWSIWGSDPVAIAATGAPGLWVGYGGNDYSNQLLHEIGHNLGLGHANFWEPSSSDPLGAGDFVEYGDRTSEMGISPSFNPLNPPAHFSHYDATQKLLLGWIPESRVVRIAGPASFDLYRHDTASLPSGPVVAVITLPDSSELFLELRLRDTQPILQLRNLVADYNEYSWTQVIDMKPLTYSPYYATGGIEEFDDHPLAPGESVYLAGQAVTIENQGFTTDDTGTHAHLEIRYAVSQPPPPHFVAQATGFTVNQGRAGTILHAQAVGPGVSFQWYRGPESDREPIADATDVTYTLPAMEAGQLFWLRAQNPAGTVFSAPITVAVQATVFPEYWSVATQGGSDYGFDPAFQTMFIPDNETLRAVDLADGTFKWSTPDPDGGFLAASYAGGQVLATDWTGVVAAYDPATGGRKWRFQPANVTWEPARYSPTPNAAGQLLVAFSRHVFCLDPATGAELWRLPLAAPPSNNNFYAKVAVSSTGRGYVVCNTAAGWPDASLECFDANTGTSIYRVTGEYHFHRVLALGNVAYCARYDGIVALDSTGTLLWRTQSFPGLGLNGASEIVDYSPTEIAVVYNDVFLRIDKLTGTITKSISLPSTTEYENPLVVTGPGRCLVQTDRYPIIALDVDHGQVLAKLGPVDVYSESDMLVRLPDRRLLYWADARLRCVGFALPPKFAAAPYNEIAPPGSDVTLEVSASADEPPALAWTHNGQSLAGASGSALTLTNLGPADAGLYFAVATGADASATSSPAIVGLSSFAKVVGTGTELTPTDVHHPNGNVFDQVLMTGPAASVTSDYAENQITRTSFIDIDGDIIQVEFSGPGTLSLVLDGATGPARPENYNQAVDYMRGHAGIVITGATERTNVSVFTVGRATAFDPTGHYNLLLPSGPNNDPDMNGSPLFLGHAETAYGGIADLAFIAIQSSNGHFGGVRAANAHFSASTGYTGLYAPYISFDGPVYIGDISATAGATPVLVLGHAGTTQINGGSLYQPNFHTVLVAGLEHLAFVAGSDSHGHMLPARFNQSRLENAAGDDVTDQYVVNP